MPKRMDLILAILSILGYWAILLGTLGGPGCFLSKDALDLAGKLESSLGLNCPGLRRVSLQFTGSPFLGPSKARLLSGIRVYFVCVWVTVVLPLSSKRICFFPRGLLNSLKRGVGLL